MSAPDLFTEPPPPVRVWIWITREKPQRGHVATEINITGDEPPVVKTMHADAEMILERALSAVRARKLKG